MRNIIIYTNRKESGLTNALASVEDVNVRLENAENIKDYEALNPGLIIVENVPDIKDVLMTTKFKSPVLFVGEAFKGCTVRAAAYDFIKTPVDNEELAVRAEALLKIRDLMVKVKVVSTTDELTGLHNRKYLHERLEQEISRSKRYSNKLSCLLFDLDFFKVVNDIYGYDWGDVLLRSIADKLKQLIRKEDILTRYGDEEFLLILPNTSESNAFLFAERFRRDIERMEFIPAGEEERHPITISGGISTYPCLENAEEDANTIIRYAEHALYNAKKRGKNKIVQFSQINLGE
ncbi:MAG: GGDEF domain-containing protein [Heliobacteriaceae bacterium]|jgi:diguanylate cyclase (GGDEF)-like protein|nr:GGDEF domain-containing protein [Heliobacteriaceae bacterium]